MNKTIIALLFSITIPCMAYATELVSVPSTGEGEMEAAQLAVDESQIILLKADQPAEQPIVTDEQNLSPDTEKGLATGDEQPLNDEIEEESQANEDPSFDVPVVLNERVEVYIHYFTNKVRDKFALWLARSERYLPMMKKTFKEKGLPEDLTYLALIESGFNDRAYSRAKAVGQWQFITGTGKRYGLRIDRWMDERRDPEKATEAAAEYLSDLYSMFNDWNLAAAGYNAGEGKIVRAIKKYDTNDFWKLSQKKYRYLRRETKDYVPKLIAAALIAKEPAKYGFNDIEYHPLLAYEKVEINGIRDIRKIAAISECSIEELKSLNPALKTCFTPPKYPGYQLKVPVGKKEVIENRIDEIGIVPEKVAFKEVGPEKMYTRKGRVIYKKVVSYTVREGDTLQDIASRYSVETRLLMSWNGIHKGQLKTGKRLKIYQERDTASNKNIL